MLSARSAEAIENYFRLSIVPVVLHLMRFAAFIAREMKNRHVDFVSRSFVGSLLSAIPGHQPSRVTDR